MCIYTVKKTKIFKELKNSSRRCATPPNDPKLDVSVVKDTAKTNDNVGMLCCIQVEYSVIFKNI